MTDFSSASISASVSALVPVSQSSPLACRHLLAAPAPAVAPHTRHLFDALIELDSTGKLESKDALSSAEYAEQGRASVIAVLARIPIESLHEELQRRLYGSDIEIALALEILLVTPVNISRCFDSRVQELAGHGSAGVSSEPNAYMYSHVEYLASEVHKRNSGQEKMGSIASAIMHGAQNLRARETCAQQGRNTTDFNGCLLGPCIGVDSKTVDFEIPNERFDPSPNGSNGAPPQPQLIGGGRSCI